MLRSVAFPALMLAAAPLALITDAAAQNRSQPQPLPITSTIPAARDIPYPGTIKLEVDATRINQAIYRVKETIPVAGAGPMALLMPQWLPGKHAPRGEIEKLAGLTITANGQRLAWRRDPLDVYAFHIDVPAGVREVIVTFEFLSATQPNQGRVVVTPDMLNLQWEAVSLYPAGYFTRQIPVEATVTYPDGWTAASGLPATREGAIYRYEKTDYETLVDSPVFAGRYFREWKLSDRVDLNVVADTPEELAASEDQIAKHRALVTQAVALFGAQHYDRYEFLLAITNKMGSIGLEHHRSSENGVDPGYFTEWDKGPGERNLLPHEMVHSWNGKYRRGADLFTPDFKTPMQDSLLWVYEGQTQFWGYVLGARSGLFTKQQTLDAYAAIAASLDTRKGREWRPLVDTTNDPIISARRPKGWVSYQRSEDYYNEGLLIWLEVDSILRRESRGKRSMDDFARAFFGVNDGDWGVLTYTFDDVVATLNAIQPYDWRTLLDTRVNRPSDRAPLAGLTDNGYKLVYGDEPSAFLKDRETRGKANDFTYSIGVVLNKEGVISSVDWGGPAYKQGLTTGATLVAVNGQTYTPERLKKAITAAKGTTTPIRLMVKEGEAYRDVVVDYHEGLRYPRLEKIASGEAGLDRLLTAK